MYAAYIALFEPLLGASAVARPLQVENAVKVGGWVGGWAVWNGEGLGGGMLFSTGQGFGGWGWAGCLMTGLDFEKEEEPASAGAHPHTLTPSDGNREVELWFVGSELV